MENTSVYIPIYITFKGPCDSNMLTFVENTGALITLGYEGSIIICARATEESINILRSFPYIENIKAQDCFTQAKK
jgi:hypothetical protein